jgi:uncharacterized membrane protein
MLPMRRRKQIWIIAAAVTAIAVLLIIVPTMRPRCTQVSGADRIAIPLEKLARGAVSFFCYTDTAGARLRFILARDDEGKVHSVMDACRQCSSFHKGYASSAKGEVICRLCGNKYHLEALEAGKASCVPVALPNRQHDGIVEVNVADLKQGSSLF